jgi:hypothetical protein
MDNTNEKESATFLKSVEIDVMTKEINALYTQIATKRQHIELLQFNRELKRQGVEVGQEIVRNDKIYIVFGYDSGDTNNIRVKLKGTDKRFNLRDI